jgi:hypothetical protein
MAVVGASALANLGSTSAGEPSQQQIVVLTSDDDDDAVEDKVKKLRVDIAVAPAPELWLGILLKAIEGDLARYLDSDEGVLVESVVDESPADKAGIKEGDILLQVGETKLSDPQTLLKVMAGLEGEGASLEITLLRKGKQQTVEVTPAKRPEMDEEAIAELEELSLDLENADEAGEAVAKVLKRLRIGDKDMNILRFGSPSVILRGGDKTGELKGDMEAVIVIEKDDDKMEVKVIRKDDQPATVTVTEDGKVTEYTADDLEEMPEEIAVIVEPMIEGKHRIRIGGLEGLNWTDVELGELDRDQIRKRAKEMAEKSRQMAERSRAAAAEALERAARQRPRLRRTDEPSEVEELKQMVAELKAEIEKLKAEIKGKDKDY